MQKIEYEITIKESHEFFELALNTYWEIKDQIIDIQDSDNVNPVELLELIEDLDYMELICDNVEFYQEDLGYSPTVNSYSFSKS